MTKKKKILFAVTNDLNYDQRMIRICTTLQEAGYDVLLIGRRKKDSASLIPQVFTQKRMPCFFQRGKAFYLEYQIRLLFTILFRPCQAICAVDLDTILPCLFTARLRGKPLIYDAHEYFTELPEVTDRPGVKRIWEFIARIAIPRTQYRYTVGPALARVLSERYGRPFALIRNLPRQEQTISRSPSDNKIILYQGALNEGRGLEEAIRAMRLLPSEFVLWLAGEGDRSMPLRKLTKDLKLESRVRFLGYVAPFKLRKITPQAYLGLNLLQNKGLNYYYSLANKCFDYLHARVPALHMDFPEYRALNKQWKIAWLLEELSPETIASAIRQLDNNPELYTQLQHNCDRAAAQLNWEREAQKLLDMYQKIFAGS